MMDQVNRGQQAYVDPGLPPDPYGAAYGPGAIGETVRHMWILASRNRWLILAIFAVAVAAAIAATMLDTPRYTANSTLQINDQSEQVLGEDIDQTQNVNSVWDVDRFLQTQLDVLQSRALAERVARRLDLANDPAFFAAMELPEPSEGLGDALHEDLAVGLLQGNLSVDLPPNTRIVTLGFNSIDPAVSADVANAFSEEFIQSNLQRRFDSSSYARNFVAEQLDEARRELESSERELNAYARDAGLIRTREPGTESIRRDAGSVVSNSLLQLNEAANRARAELVAAESVWRAEQNTPLFSSQAVLANPTVQNLMTRRAELQAKLDAARERYLDDHPTVQQLSSELDTVNAQMESTAQSVRNSILARFVAARDAEAELRSQVNELQGATLEEQERSVRYNTLAREADTNRSIYDGLLQRYRELNASAGVAASNVAIIDRAVPPSSPSSPSLVRNLALALLLAGVLAVVLVFLRDQLDDAIRVPEDVEEKVGLPLLGVIPRDEDDDPMAALEDPKTAVNESYNSLRGSLLYSTREGLPSTILVTSSQPTEGKSTTSYAIARSLARLGRRVLLVDADLRRPMVHRLIDHDNAAGLSTLLISDVAIETTVAPSGEDNFDILPSGPIPPSPTELLTSPRMAKLLGDLRESYDCVIVDSSPVLGLADAPTLAAMVEGVVFVIEASRGRGGSLKSALRRLRSVEPTMLGAVLTKFDPDKAGNSYSSYHSYEYYRYSTQTKS